MKDFVLSPMPLDDLKDFIKKCVQEGINANNQSTHQTADSNDYLTADEAAQFLKVSLVSIHNWKRDKGLPFYRIGRSIRFKKVDLVAFTEGSKRKRRA